MIHKPDIHAIAKKIMRHQRGVRDHHIIHPGRDWLIGIGLSLVVVATVGYWAVTMYIEISNRSVEVSTAPTSDIVVYRTELVQAALARFGERATTYRELLQNRINDTPTPVLETRNEPSGTSTEEVPLADEVSATENEAVENGGVPALSFE